MKPKRPEEMKIKKVEKAKKRAASFKPKSA
jgi:hypothetical protein